MIQRARLSKLIVLSLLGVVAIGICRADDPKVPKGVTLYTPYTQISVPPGESIDYSVDVINGNDAVENLEISVTGIPRGWNYDLKSGGWKIGQIAVLPSEKKTLSLKVEVPVQVNKGTYQFKVTAGKHTLPLTIIVSAQGTYKTEFTTDQANMEGQSSATFNYSANLRNRTAEQQMYALTSTAPRGWNVSFRANGKQVTSVEVAPNATTNVSIEIKPPASVGTGTFKIPVRAFTSSTSAELEFEAVVTDSYTMELTTPTGLLSTSITAGDVKRIELEVRNTGASELKGIEFTASKPANWDVTFEPDKVESLFAGSSTTVTAVVKASRKAIPGDYVIKMTAKIPETSSSADFRIAVKTSMLWGWVGILVIVAVLGGVYYLFRKYGRR
jgi:uncharacterized membrane protein